MLVWSWLCLRRLRDGFMLVGSFLLLPMLLVSGCGSPGRRKSGLYRRIILSSNDIVWLIYLSYHLLIGKLMEECAYRMESC